MHPQSIVVAPTRREWTWSGLLAGSVIAGGLLFRQNPVLLIATALAAAAAVISFSRPRWGPAVFFGWVAIADFIKRLIFLGANAAHPPTEFEYFWILLLPDFVLFAIVARVALEALRTRRLSFRPNLLDILVAGYLGWSFLTILNPTFPLSVRLAGFKSSSVYIVLYFIVRSLGLEDLRWVRRVRAVALWAGLVSGLYALYQALFGFQEFELRWLESGLTALGGGEDGLGVTISLFGIVRPFSLFASHEQLGFFLGFAVLIMLGFGALSRLEWVAVAFLTLSIARTLSRSSWVFLIIGLLAVGALARIVRQQRLLKRGLLTGFVFFLSILLWTYAPRWVQLAGPSQGEAFGQRAGMLGSYEWRIFSFEQLLNNPEWRKPFGNGIGSMWVGWRMNAPGTANPDERILSHIGTIDILYELGWVGLLLFAGLIVALTTQTLRRLLGKPRPASSGLLIVAVSTVLAVVAANTTVATVLMFRPIAAPFWMMLGVAAALASANPAPAGEPLPGRTPSGPSAQAAD